MRYLLLALAFVAGTACGQNSVERYQEGAQYQRIENPIAVNPPSGKVDVVEVFSYACHFCNDLEPMLIAWKQTPSARNVELSYVPATFNPTFALVGQGFYAAEALGIREKTHQAIFDAIFKENVRPTSLDALAEIYARHGVTKEQFLEAANSFGVRTKLDRGLAYQRQSGIDGVPTFIVNGKWRVSPATAGSNEEAFRVLDFLIAKELAETKKP